MKVKQKLVDKISKSFYNNTQVDCIYTDLVNAFHLVHHNILKSKLFKTFLNFYTLILKIEKLI